MIEFVLTKEMETGIVKIDDQHRELINRINELWAMGSQAHSKEEIKKTLDLLGEYVVQHFDDEEKLQIQCNYPRYEIHKQEHQGFIDEFQKLKKKFSEEEDISTLALELIRTITVWVVKHIQHSDTDIGMYYNLHKE